MGKGASKYFLFFFKTIKLRQPFDFEKIKAVREGVFIFFIWFCYNSQVGSEVIKYFNMHKLLFKFGGG